MTYQTNFKALATALVATAFAMTSMPAAASDGATRLMQTDVDGSPLYVTRGNQVNGPTVPHRPETDPHFPRR
jgi:hypothetical protein